MFVILDPGHGKDTPGKRSGELEEWRFNRYVMKYVMFDLKSLGIPYHVLVNEDYDVPLRSRSIRANKVAEQSTDDCFLLSIHGNAYPDSDKVSGIETWYHSESGKKLAKVFQHSLISELGWVDRGLKKGNFWILKHTTMPAVLLELGFYTNPNERANMLDAEYQYRMGLAITRAIKEIVGNESV